jgi:site-specific recombinase XerD
LAEEEGMKLSAAIHQFFDHYLPHIKGVSPYTIRAYRDAFKLFLPFAAKHYGIKIRSLRVEHISSKLILSFLEELQKERKNLTRTRNHRLAAIKSFAKMIRFMYPDHRELADTILNIPQKRYQKTLIGFLYHDEILKVFKAVDLRRKEGFRDYSLLHLLFDSGARASEITTLNLDYFNPQLRIGPFNFLSSISPDIALPQSPSINTVSLSVNGARNSPVTGSIVSVKSISPEHYHPSALNTSTLCTPFDTPGP